MPTYPRLRHHKETDIAIVGGGITGALIAEAMARAGAGVIVLEGGRIGRGSTAASSALILREPDYSLSELIERYGAPSAERIWRLCHASVRELVDRLTRLRIACDLERRDAVYLATTEDSATRLEQELARRRQAGFGGRWLGPGALRRLTAITAHGAIRSAGHAQLDPYKACVGLVAEAAAAGVEIYEGSAVTRIVPGRDRVRIHTRHGRVDARRVVVATGYATPGFRPLAGRFTMYRTYVTATERLTAADRREIGLSDVMVWDTEKPYRYARWTRDHRLLMGGADRLIKPGASRAAQFTRATRELRDEFTRLLPALSKVRIESAWEGAFALTPDSLPYIGPHPRYPGHLFALGYGGNGMTFAALAAKLLVAQWRGVTSPDHALFSFGRFTS